MSVGQLTPPPIVSQSSAPATTARPDRGYRILFYLSTGASLALAWTLWNRPQLINPTGYTTGRDRQYSFVVDAYGYKYQGHTGNIIDDHALQFGAFEKDRLFFVRDYLKNLADPNAAVIDVGANTGHHTLFYSRHASRVFAFEPFPPVIDKFKKNLALNPHVTNVELFEVGLGDRESELPFQAPDENNHGEGSFRGETGQVANTKQGEWTLKIVVGDEYLKGRDIGRLAFVKVDVEGFEEPVLLGLRQVLEKHRPVLEVEVSPVPMGTVDSFARLKALFPEDYHFFVLPRSLDGAVGGQYRLEKLDPDSVNRGDQIEVIACPAERLQSLPGR